MVSPISDAHALDVQQTSKPSAPKTSTQAQSVPAKSGAVSQDQVTLKSAGEGDREGDGK